MNFNEKRVMSLTELELSQEAYVRVPGRAILLYEMRIFNERGEVNFIRDFIYFPDENDTLRHSEEDSKKMALYHAKENLPPEIFVKGVEIQWTEWGTTYPWARKKVLETLTMTYNNQDVSSYNPFQSQFKQVSFQPTYNLNDLNDFPEMDTNC